MKFIISGHFLKESLNIPTANGYDVTTFLTDDMVVAFVGYKLINHRACANIGYRNPVLVRQALQRSINSGLIDRRQKCADFFVNLKRSQVTGMHREGFKDELVDG